MLKEFKEFALKGNILDLAVGIIIGGAFQKIVTSLVEDIIMPSVSLITGTVDYSNLAIQIGDISIKYGAFLTAIIDFLIIAFSIFLLIKYINRVNRNLDKLNKKQIAEFEKTKLGQEIKKHKKPAKVEEAPAPTTKICPFCQTEIHINATRCPHCTSKLEEK